MANQAIQNYDFGGVDSRSSPLLMPTNRALRCRNWAPNQAGYLELRYGYSTVSMSTVSVSRIHSIIPFTLWDGTRYCLLGEDTGAPKLFAVANGAVSTPALKGVAIASPDNKWSSFVYNNRIHIGNGTDQKWFDGTTYRDSGLRTLTSAEILNVIVTDGIIEITPAMRAGVTVAAAAGGASPATTTGQLFYVVFFDTTVNELGPATAFVGTRVPVTLNQKVTLSGLPNLATYNTNVIKLIAATADGGTNAYFCYTNPKPIISITRTANVTTVVATGHGAVAGNAVILNGLTDNSFNGVFNVLSTPDGNTYTISNPGPNGSVAPAGANTVLALAAGNAVTTIDVLNTSLLSINPNVIANSDRGIPASAVGGANPGYQFYVSIFNPNGGGHVGNRVSINTLILGGRWLPASRANVHISGLPDLSGSDTEWVKLIGRTGDGGQVPYAISDQVGNWITVPNASTSITVTQSGIAGTSEMPSRNGIIPPACDKFAVVGDRVYAADSISPTIRRSGSALDDRTGDFVGRPEQSWAADDIETFPTAHTPTCIAEYNLELIVGTLSDSAILNDESGQMLWRGPWNVGFAGPRAFCKTPYGFFWLTGDKQLASIVNSEPVPISGEYELGLLANIGDANLGAVELVYLRDIASGKDQIIIKALDANNNPFHVIHDFRLREASTITTAAASPMGQGYECIYLGPLASDYTVAQVRDANGRMRIWAGSSVGQLYQLVSGANDAGNEFHADYIALLNAGTDRPSIPWVEWYGDSQVSVSVGKVLKTSLAPNSEFNFTVLNLPGAATIVQGGENDFQYRADLPAPEAKHVYLRFELNSHSLDGDLTLTSPPHIPVEDYGRVYAVIPIAGKPRGV